MRRRTACVHVSERIRPAGCPLRPTLSDPDRRDGSAPSAAAAEPLVDTSVTRAHLGWPATGVASAGPHRRRWAGTPVSLHLERGMSYMAWHTTQDIFGIPGRHHLMDFQGISHRLHIAPLEVPFHTVGRTSGPAGAADVRSLGRTDSRWTGISALARFHLYDTLRSDCQQRPTHGRTLCRLTTRRTSLRAGREERACSHGHCLARCPNWIGSSPIDCRPYGPAAFATD